MYGRLTSNQRNAEELSSYQKKIIQIDDHMGIALAGLAPDARVLSNFLREKAMNQRMIFNRPLSVEKAADLLASKAQKNTQGFGSRPYGVGLLVVGYDETGAHLFEFQPSGQSLEYFGCAIGARSQAGRTYLERNFDEYKTSTSEELIVHGLKALRETLQQDKELNSKNTSVAVATKDGFKIYDDEEVQQWLDKLDTLGNARDDQDDNDDNNNDDGDDDDDSAPKKEEEEVKDEDKMETD
ncbi:proteasome core particle subunit alpha 6 [Cyberlindnera jadinii NRRL Y-1542]|uniref:Proteasome-domain-containing protein n=1 Tax=Cyberlindnera jadinii (strain ATCC 18201 / CBS 1600 / BCRC 20928 / JCM 3617 / NBRC 0987 / NRRL Y-1542) TaxID=983966 RepID=A0A1E4RUP5_CYBJN|nr:proteasome-domain-containing protein [Cyberlindnera jadinii NRRL Y-1542]ODV71004.1 proteasome-domain-containing protein [Cyberlindnera jadinii NRRL Y-1542]